MRGRGKMLVQAEDADYKSSPTIRAESWEDAFSIPQSYGAFRLNSLGGWRWRLPGEWIEWDIEVPQDGLYAITMKAWQGWRGRFPRYRSLMIDGEIPFRETEDLLFRPDNEWQYYEVGKEETGEPFLFALKKGKHVIRMQVTVGALSETLRTLVSCYRDVQPQPRDADDYGGESRSQHGVGPAPQDSRPHGSLPLDP